jgi:hypothetical protein
LEGRTLKKSGNLIEDYAVIKGVIMKEDISICPSKTVRESKE